MIKGKKGAIVEYFALFAFVVAAVLLLFNVVQNSNVVDFAGVTSTNLMASYEFSERVAYYVDMSMELASKQAATNVLKNSGYQSVVLSSVQKSYPCGFSVYPIINEGEDVDKCAPNFEEEYKKEFQTLFESHLMQYPFLRLRMGDFGVEVLSDTGDLVIIAKGITPIDVPFYSDSNEFYAANSAYFNSLRYLTEEDHQLVKLVDIDKVNCEHSPEPNPPSTNHGRICMVKKAIYDTLKVISEEELKPRGWTMNINQAFRDYRIQKSLHNAYGKGACNPDTSSQCPHMLGGAVDITIFDENGRPFNRDQKDEDMVEELMCKYGFVRYNKEAWHFEIGTYRWEQAIDARDRGEKACAY